MQVLWLRFLNVISHLKEAGLLAEMADSRSGAGDVQGEPGTFCPARNQGTIKDYWGCIRKTEEQIWKG